MAANPLEQRALIEQIAMRDFRCFHGEHSARLAPLTLVVGENSTGKTSFLALVRALWEVAYNDKVPDFKRKPYDLGSFSEIVHRRGGSAARIEQFEAELQARDATDSDSASNSFRAIFERRGTAPFPAVRYFSNDKGFVRAVQERGTLRVHVETTNGSSWNTDFQVRFAHPEGASLEPLHFAWVMQSDTQRESELPPDDIEDLMLDLPIFQA